VHSASAEQSDGGPAHCTQPRGGFNRRSGAVAWTLALTDTFHSTSRLDVSLLLLPSAKPLKDRARVTLHAFTMETIAEVRLHEAKQVRARQPGVCTNSFGRATLLLPGAPFHPPPSFRRCHDRWRVVLDAAPLRSTAGRDAFLKVLAGGSAVSILRSRIARRTTTNIPHAVDG